jgi:hypothetical protein
MGQSRIHFFGEHCNARIRGGNDLIDKGFFGFVIKFFPCVNLREIFGIFDEKCPFHRSDLLH